QYRKRSAETPLKRKAKLVRDEVRVKGAVGASDQLRRRIVSHHCNEGEDETGNDTGASGWQCYRDQPSPRLRTEVSGGIQHGRVDPLDRDIGREKREREQEVDERDHDGRPAEAEEVQRRIHES